MRISITKDGAKILLCGITRLNKKLLATEDIYIFIYFYLRPRIHPHRTCIRQWDGSPRMSNVPFSTTLIWSCSTAANDKDSHCNTPSLHIRVSFKCAGCSLRASISSVYAERWTTDCHPARRRKRSMWRDTGQLCGKWHSSDLDQ